METQIRCPFCKNFIETESSPPTQELTCPICGNKISAELLVRLAVYEKLLDPADPAGYFSNFPTEDDGMS